MKKVIYLVMVFGFVFSSMEAQKDRGTQGIYYSWNILQNEGFEMPVHDWQAVKSSTISRNSEEPYSGLFSNEIMLVGNDTAGIELDIAQELNKKQPELYWIGGAFKSKSPSDTVVIRFTVNISSVSGDTTYTFESEIDTVWCLVQDTINLDWTGDVSEATIMITWDDADGIFLCDEVWMRQAMDLSTYRFTYPAEYPVIQTFRNLDETPENLLRFSIVHEMGGKDILEDVRALDSTKTIVGQSSWGFAGGSSIKTEHWPGYFLYGEAVMLSQDLNTTSDTIYITNASKIVESQDGPDPYFDVTIIRIVNDSADWSYVEHCEVIGRNTVANYIVVRRASEGSMAKSFVSGQAYVAQHASWLGNTHSWMYNFSPRAPRRKDVATDHPEYMMNGAEYWPYEFKDYFNNKPHLDGIQFDVAKSEQNNYGIETDCDNDRVVDYGWFDGVNTVDIGSQNVMRNMRNYWGQDKLFNVDGEGPAWVHTTKYVDGFQFEAAFSSIRKFGQNYDFFDNMLARFQRDIRYTYVYFIQHEKPDNEFRLSMAAATLLEMPYSYNPNRESDFITERDEFWGGELNQLGWLGEPVGPLQKFYEFTPDEDLFAGVTWQVKNESGYASTASDITGGKNIDVTAVPANSKPDYYGVKLYTSDLNQSDLDAGSLYTLVFEAQGDDDWNFDGIDYEDRPRAIQAEGFAMQANNSNKSTRSGFLVGDEWRQFVVTYLTEQTPDEEEIGFGVGYEVGETAIRNIQLYKGNANRYMREFENGLVVANASDKAWTVEIGAGYKRIRGSVNPDINTGLPMDAEITVAAQDALFLIKYDTSEHQPPVINFISPKKDEEILVDSIFSIEVDVPFTHKNSGLKSVDLYLDDVLISTSTSEPYLWLSDTISELKGLSVGSYNLKAIANDLSDSIGMVEVTFNIIEPNSMFIEAEDYSHMEGVEVENCYDTVGGKPVGLALGFISSGDWAEYDVNVINDGFYAAIFRVASKKNNNVITVKKGASTLGAVVIPETGNWQNWIDSDTVKFNLNTGEQTLRLDFSGSSKSLYNLNWWKLDRIGELNSIPINHIYDQIKIYPVPVLDHVFIEGAPENARIVIYNMLGHAVKIFRSENSLDISTLNSGIYFIQIEGIHKIYKITKQ